MESRLALKWFQEHSLEFSGELFFNEVLSRYTYFQIGGPATVVAVPRSITDLQWLTEAIRSTGIPLFIMGKGSNLLVSDSGFDGLVVRTHRLNLEIEKRGASQNDTSFSVRTGASVANSTLLRKAAQEGWKGLEFLTGIPGAVGGAVFMNAGTHLGESQERLLKVKYFPLLEDKKGSGDLCTKEGDALKFTYRKNLFLPAGALVYSAEWRVEQGDPAEVKALIDQTLARRKATQPVDFPSCGSVFKNPKEWGLSAWQVVDRLGLRGYRVGAAQFAEKHSNFILNLGGAKASDVRALIELAKSRAKSEWGIILEEEVIYLGA